MVAEDEVVLQLDEDVACTEPRDPAPQRRFRLGVAALLHEPRHEAVPAAGEQDQAVRMILQRLDRQHGIEAARLAAVLVVLEQPKRLAGEATKVGVSLAPFGKQHEVMLCAVRLRDREFEAGDR